MKIEYSTKPNKSDWKYILDHSNDANVFQSIPYIKTQRRLGDKIYYTCAYKDGIPCSIIIAQNSPYGRFKNILEVGSRSGGGPLIVDGVKENKLIGKKIVEEFDRKVLPRVKLSDIYFYGPFYVNLDDTFSNLGYIKQNDYTLLLDLTISIPSLWKNLNKKCRNAIRYAQKCGIKVALNNSLDSFDTFYGLYRETSERWGFKPMKYSIFKKKFKSFSKENIADLWFAKQGDDFLSGAIIMKFNDKIDYIYTGSLSNGWIYKPNNLLQWGIIQHYKNKGYKIYNMWGVIPLKSVGKSKDVRSYGKFKLSFGPKMLEISRFAKNLKKNVKYN